MSDLDERLKTLILTVAPDNKYPIVKLDIVVNQIHQAFADEGYLPHVDIGKHVKVGDKLYITNGVDSLMQVDLAKYMTGQEWYDRFEKELIEASKPTPNEVFLILKKSILEAAKRASGIEDEK